MIFRLSQKLNSKIKTGTQLGLPLHENLLVDWSAHLFVAERTQYILLSNTKCLYSTVMCGKGITNNSVFVERALNSIRDLMDEDGQRDVYERCIAPATESVRFAKALNRAHPENACLVVEFVDMLSTLKVRTTKTSEEKETCPRAYYIMPLACVATAIRVKNFKEVV